jgi:hypothetical protein
MTMTDLHVSDHLAQYQDQITQILVKLSDASVVAHQAASDVGDGTVYLGRAQEQMSLFYDSLAANIDKLIMVESMASLFLQRVQDDFAATDRLLNTLIKTGGA